MKKKWETKDGDEIEYKKLENSHLLNILKWIERRAKSGILIEVGGGGWDIDDMWYDSWIIKGKEVLEKYDYDGLKKEAQKRKII